MPGTWRRPYSQHACVRVQVPGKEEGLKGGDGAGMLGAGAAEEKGEGRWGPTFVLDQALHLLLDAVAPVGDVHVQGVVTAALPIRPFSPLLIGLRQAGLRLGHHVVN